MITVKKIESPAEMQDAFAIRTKVFVEEQHCPPHLERANEEESVHFLAVVGTEPCGACRWRATTEGFKLERFAVLPAYRGKGVGQELVKATLKDLPPNAAPIYLNAQVDAVGLYQKFGFVTDGPQFEEAGIQHFRMVKK